MINNLSNLFKERRVWISVREGQTGLEFYPDPDIKLLSKPNKRLLKAFLEGIIEEL